MLLLAKAFIHSIISKNVDYPVEETSIIFKFYFPDDGCFTFENQGQESFFA